MDLSHFVRASAGLLVAAGVLVLGSGSPRATSQTAGSQSTPRVVAIGDVHGAADAFVQILQMTGLIDAQQKWIGGTTVFVQTGDIFDRGPGVKAALDLLMRLEDEARRAGGRVEALIGNHEAMNLLGDFRDVSEATFTSFADTRSEDRRKRAYDDYVKIAKRRGGKGDPVATRDEWMAAHPPGFVEYVDALGPRGKYGKWIRSHDVVTAVNRTAFMHAGIRPDLPGTLDDVNRVAAADIMAWDTTRAMMTQAQLVPVFCTLKEAVSAAAAEVERIAAAIKAQAPLEDYVTRDYVDRLQKLLQIDKWSLVDGEGPLWFRGYATLPETPENTAQLAALLTRLGVDRFVTAHTPMLPAGRITARFTARFFLIDTGMLSAYFKGGRASALEIQDGRITAIYTDSKTVLVDRVQGTP
jgi:calcineurin-like phosphoesterase family protein